VNGAQGSATASDVKTIADATVANGYNGIMVWFGSVVNGFTYDRTWDTCNYPAR
jgi:hypothetical protein